MNDLFKKDLDSLDVVFDALEDPRIDRRKLYPLKEIMFLTIAATLSSCDSWRGISLFAENRLEWLRRFFSFDHGVPNHQSIGRVFFLPP